jgi:hypothetical protein
MYSKKVLFSAEIQIKMSKYQISTFSIWAVKSRFEFSRAFSNFASAVVVYILRLVNKWPKLDEDLCKMIQNSNHL